MDFINLERTSSVPFRPNGVYKGKVVEIDETTNTVSLTLPRVTAKAVRTRCKVLSAVMPSVGDEVGCVFAENEASEVYVLGVIRNTQSDDTAPIIVCTSSTRPSSPPAGTLIYETDTTLGYFWTGTVWVSVEGSEQNFGNVFFSADGLGIGVATASQPLSIAQTSGTDYVSYNKSASAGLTNASAGAVIIGRATGPNVVVDSTTYAANNGTGASTALTGTVVQARNNGNPAALYLNPNGGDVRLETGGLVVNGNVTTLAGSSARLEMPLNATYVDSGTMDFNRLGMAYPTSSAPAASATPIGHQFYNTTTHELLVNSGSGYRKPWNMPWGVVGYTAIATNYTATGTVADAPEDVTGLSATFTAVANRYYRTTVQWGIVSLGAGASYTVSWIADGSNVLKGQTNFLFQSVDMPMVNTLIETGLSGSVTRKSRISRSNTGHTVIISATSTIKTFIVVEDIGPVAGSTPPKGTFTLDSPSMGILNQNVLG